MLQTLINVASLSQIAIKDEVICEFRRKIKADLSLLSSVPEAASQLASTSPIESYANFNL